ncbi:hypothetical protein [Methanohalobium sp.]|uniref:hypothetical protein n=1 Tax=Methanohalobium sp. TaxID=2837493 RepID=UPI0025F3F36F|nr:hypothetical protein [Methanohalobium sp.]
MDFWITKLSVDQIDTHVWYLIDEQTYGGANKAYADFLGLEKEDFENVDIFDVHDSKEAKVCIEVNKKVIETKDKSIRKNW